MRATPICASCKWYSPTIEGTTGYLQPRCFAYPRGIPKAIITDGFDHRQPYFGDGGRRYEPDPANRLQLLDYLNDVDSGRLPRTKIALDGEAQGGPRPVVWPIKRHQRSTKLMGRDSPNFVSRRSLEVWGYSEDSHDTSITMPELVRGRELPSGWIRFVAMPFDNVHWSGSGLFKAGTTQLTPEEYLRNKGWTEAEIDHALGKRGT